LEEGAGVKCKFCQRPIGEVTDCDGGKHGWTHDPGAGPDSFSYCGDEYGTYAMPESTVIDGLIANVAAVQQKPNLRGFTRQDYDEFMDGQL
jgi:hypothetical protein